MIGSWQFNQNLSFECDIGQSYLLCQQVTISLSLCIYIIFRHQTCEREKKKTGSHFHEHFMVGTQQATKNFLFRDKGRHWENKSFTHIHPSVLFWQILLQTREAHWRYPFFLLGPRTRQKEERDISRVVWLVVIERKKNVSEKHGGKSEEKIKN